MGSGLVFFGGSGAVTFPLLATPADSAAAPNYSWLADPNTGFYNIGADQIGVSTGGTLRLTVSTTAVTSAVQILAPDGNTGALSYGFATASYGTYKGAAGGGGAIVFTCAGTDQFAIGQNSGVGTQQVGPLGFTAAISASTADVQLARLAAASLRLGLAPSATPISQIFTIGEASRPATDTNVGGASGTIRSGLGTGTGAASSLIFQTPTLVGAGSTTQTYATRLTIATAGITATVRVTATEIVGTSFVGIGSGGYTWNASASNGFYSNGDVGIGGDDLHLARLAAASLRLGLAPSATPIAQTFTIGEASRPGTDTNVGGANGTIQPGLGTGDGTLSSLLIRGPTKVGSGTSAQTYATIAEFATTGITLYGAGITSGNKLQILYKEEAISVGSGVGTVTGTAGFIPAGAFIVAGRIRWTGTPGGGVTYQAGITGVTPAYIPAGSAPTSGVATFFGPSASGATTFGAYLMSTARQFLITFSGNTTDANGAFTYGIWYFLPTVV